MLQVLSCMPLQALPPRALQPVAADATSDAVLILPRYMAAAPELGKLQHAKQAVWGLFTEQVQTSTCHGGMTTTSSPESDASSCPHGLPVSPLLILPAK